MQSIRSLITAHPIIIGSSLALNTLLVIACVLSGASFVHAQEETFYFLTDHLGSVEVVLDENANVVERRDYLPYGTSRVPQIPRPSHVSDTVEPRSFTGKQLDTQTGLHYYGARYYDSDIGRFTTLDPWEGELTDPQTLNKYSYTINNPIRFIDPTGMYKEETGEVEKGDTLGKITSQLNNTFGTDYSYSDIATFNGISDPDSIGIGDKVYMGAYNTDGTTWLRSYDAGEVTINYWNSLNTQQQQITHFGRNLFQGDLPQTTGDMQFWEWNNMGEAVAHNMAGASGNIDYRGSDLRFGQQAVYDQTGALVTAPENVGTYDFVSPMNSFSGHSAIDVEPWIQWGNSPYDSTSRWDRQRAYAVGIMSAGKVLIRSLFE